MFLETVLSDLAEAFDRGPDDGLDALQALLLDEAACQARAVVLRRQIAHAQATFPQLAEQRPAGFDAELAAIRGGRLRDALADGSVSPERLIALTNDPDALLAAHRALMEPLDDEASSSPSPPASGGEGW